MWEWIATWTFWNWLTVILVVPALIGFINALLSLRARWRDWRSLRSKKTFEKRLQEMEFQFSKAQLFRASTSHFFLSILHDSYELLIEIIFIASLFLAACYCFIVSLDSTFTSYLKIFSQIFLSTSIFITVSLLRKTFKISRTLLYARHPEILAIEVIRFVNTAKRKELISSDFKTIADSIADSAIFDESDKEHIKERVKYIGKT